MQPLKTSRSVTGDLADAIYELGCAQGELARAMCIRDHSDRELNMKFAFESVERALVKMHEVRDGSTLSQHVQVTMRPISPESATEHARRVS